MRRHLPWIACAAIAIGIAISHFHEGSDAAVTCVPSDRPAVERCVAGLRPQQARAITTKQHATNWCWAATLSMLLRHYGVHVDQADIVRAQYGVALNEPIGADAYWKLLNRTWTDDRGRSVVLSASLVRTRAGSAAIAAPEVIEDLRAERPLIIGTINHAMLLVQVVYDRERSNPNVPVGLSRVVVIDPADFAGIRSLRVPEWSAQLLARVDPGSEDALAPTSIDLEPLQFGAARSGVGSDGCSCRRAPGPAFGSRSGARPGAL